MLARRKAKLPFYLNALREKEYAEKYPGCLLNNFHNLLRFWQRHYLNKDKDSTCLENVSGSHSFLHTPETYLDTLISPKSSPAASHKQQVKSVLSVSTVVSLACFQNMMMVKSQICSMVKTKIA